MTTPPIQAAYLGPPASFSHQAALNLFTPSSSPPHSPNSTAAPQPQLVPHPTFSSIFAAVQSSSSTAPVYGVVPFENSSNGSVVQLLDLLADREGIYGQVRVCAEYYLRVRHCLLGGRSARRLPPSGSLGSILQGEEGEEAEEVEDALRGVQKLYTHPQAWGQCSEFLDKRFRGVERQDVSSTSRAAEMVAQEQEQEQSQGAVGGRDGGGHGRSAAIASKLAAEVYGLRVLQEGIEDQGNNVTRFFLLRREEEEEERAGENTPQHQGETDLNGVEAPTTSTTTTAKKFKSLISFTIDHSTPGALADALGIFRQRGFNLTSIDTRPSRIRPWHYIFFVECEQAEKVPDAVDRLAVDHLMSDLGGVAQSCRHLGRWRDELDGIDSAKTRG